MNNNDNEHDKNDKDDKDDKNDKDDDDEKPSLSGRYSGRPDGRRGAPRREAQRKIVN